jgi:purine-binding chemotaxis protein CheW
MSVVTEQDGERYALLVHKVAEVISVPAETYKPDPPTLSASRAGVSDGIYRLDRNLIMALNVERVLELPPSWRCVPASPASRGGVGRL